MATIKRTDSSVLGELYMQLRDRKRLARLMVIQGVSQRELATVAGWRAHSYLGRLLRGEVSTLDRDPALRIAAHLQVPFDDLFLVRVTSIPGATGQRSRKVPA